MTTPSCASLRLAPFAAAAGLALALAAPGALAFGGGSSSGMSTTPAGANIDDAQADIDAGRFSDALDKLATLEKQNPRDADVLNLMGFSERKLGNFDAALKYYERALAQAPKHLNANEYLGELYLQTGHPDKAKERLAVLEAACGSCEQYEDLDKAIDRYQEQKAMK